MPPISSSWRRPRFDRRLPHAPSRSRGADRPFARGGRAIRRGGRRARGRRDLLHRACLLLPCRPTRLWDQQYHARALRPRPRPLCAAPSSRRRDEGSRSSSGSRSTTSPVASGRPRTSSRPIRGTFCSARSTSSTVSRSTRSRGWSRARPARGLAALLRLAAERGAERTVRLALSSRPRRSTTDRGRTRKRSVAARGDGRRDRSRGCLHRESRPPACTSRRRALPRPTAARGLSRSGRADHARLGRARAAERRS